MTDTLNRPLHDHAFPGESAGYRQARNALLEAEIDLRRHTERVAALRRALPAGGEVPEDYAFAQSGTDEPVRLSQLFGPHTTLVAYSFMFGPAMERPCPSCTSILDSLDGAAPHVEQQVALVAIARSPIGRFQAFADERGWRRLRLLSSAANSYNRDYFGETATGSQSPMLNVFRKEDGVVRHAFATELMFAPGDPGQDPRHVDTIWPLWNVLDFTPLGRGDFRPKLSYGG